MDYQIVATLGPRSADESLWRRLLSAGATGFRLNTSHLSLDELQRWLGRLLPFLDSLTPRPALTLDLQGSKWRLGVFQPFTLRRGQVVSLVHGGESLLPGCLPIPHADFFRAAQLSSLELALDDARVLLRVEGHETEHITARVLQGGCIQPHKGITYQRSNYRHEEFNAKDQAILEMARGLGNIRYAISYLRDATEMARYRALCGQAAYLVAKLERQSALDDWLAIAASADELWLCRGDLGAELGMRRMAEETAHMTSQVNQCSKPFLLAGQVLEHMTRHPTSTRSELCYLHDALAAGYAGVVLSDETAIGRHPVEACHSAALFRDEAIA